jgi:hypothetical protein
MRIGSVGLEFFNVRVVDSEVPVTVVVEMVTLCSCFDREDAFCVILVACLRLSVAVCEEASCAVKPVVTDPLIIGIPPETVPVMLN